MRHHVDDLDRACLAEKSASFARRTSDAVAPLSDAAAGELLGRLARDAREYLRDPSRWGPVMWALEAERLSCAWRAVDLEGGFE